MKTNLIQNYIAGNNAAMGSSQPLPAQQNLPLQQPQTPLKHGFNIEEHLYNRTFIKPLPPKAKLVNGSILNAPMELVKDWAYEAKALKDGINGNANDHQLGKLNDVGLKIGGLAIAGYLASRKTTPLTKAMEFIGLGSFLFAMSVWPKLAIQLPAKLIHGVNTRQMYEDSYGRKKPLTLDPQFLPLDLYSDKKIDKIGNWQGVPKDIPNRRDFIQEKIRKHSVQSNTMWMLTAGFATPVMSGLICNALTPYVEEQLSKYDNKINEKMMEDFPGSVMAARNDSIIDKVNRVIQFSKDKPINEELTKELSEILSSGSNKVLAESIDRDLKELLQNDRFIVDNSITEHINKNLIITLTRNLDEDIVTQIVPTTNQISDIFVKGKYLNNAYTEKEHRDIIRDIRKTLLENVEEYNKVESNTKLDAEFIEDLISNVDIKADPIKKGLKKVPARTFDVNTQNEIKKIAEAVTDFRAKEKVLHRYAFKKVAAVEDSTLAFEYNKITDKLVKLLNIDPKEFDNARYDRELMGNLITKTFERIAADKEEYSRVMSGLADFTSGLSKNIKESDIASYKKHLRNSFIDSSNTFKNLGMTHTSASLTGLDPQNGKGSYLKVMEDFVTDRINGVRYILFRTIDKLDMFKRIATLENASVLTNPNIPREIKEAHLQMVKREGIQAHSSDYTVKFYDLRNPHPNFDDFSNIEIDSNGNPIFKYLGKEDGKKVAIPQDYKYFQNSMHLMDGDAMHPQTQEILKSKNLLEKLNEYRRNVIEILGGEKYFVLPEHIATIEKESTSEQRFLLSGVALDELFTKKAKQIHNSKVWLKMFGGFGAGLLAVTVLSQFFFGRVKLPDSSKNINKVNTNA